MSSSEHVVQELTSRASRLELYVYDLQESRKELLGKAMNVANDVAGLRKSIADMITVVQGKVDAEVFADQLDRKADLDSAKSDRSSMQKRFTEIEDSIAAITKDLALKVAQSDHQADLAGRASTADIQKAFKALKILKSLISQLEDRSKRAEQDKVGREELLVRLQNVVHEDELSQRLDSQSTRTQRMLKELAAVQESHYQEFLARLQTKANLNNAATKEEILTLGELPSIKRRVQALERWQARTQRGGGMDSLAVDDAIDQNAGDSEGPRRRRSAASSSAPAAADAPAAAEPSAALSGEAAKGLAQQVHKLRVNNDRLQRQVRAGDTQIRKLQSDFSRMREEFRNYQWQHLRTVENTPRTPRTARGRPFNSDLPPLSEDLQLRLSDMAQSSTSPEPDPVPDPSLAPPAPGSDLGNTAETLPGISAALSDEDQRKIAAQAAAKAASEAAKRVAELATQVQVAVESVSGKVSEPSPAFGAERGLGNLEVVMQSISSLHARLDESLSGLAASSAQPAGDHEQEGSETADVDAAREQVSDVGRTLQGLEGKIQAAMKALEDRATEQNQKWDETTKRVDGASTATADLESRIEEQEGTIRQLQRHKSGLELQIASMQDRLELLVDQLERKSEEDAGEVPWARLLEAQSIPEELFMANIRGAVQYHDKKLASVFDILETIQAELRNAHATGDTFGDSAADEALALSIAEARRRSSMGEQPDRSIALHVPTGLSTTDSSTLPVTAPPKRPGTVGAPLTPGGTQTLPAQLDDTHPLMVALSKKMESYVTFSQQSLRKVFDDQQFKQSTELARLSSEAERLWAAKGDRESVLGIENALRELTDRVKRYFEQLVVANNLRMTVEPALTPGGSPGTDGPRCLSCAQPLPDPPSKTEMERIKLRSFLAKNSPTRAPREYLPSIAGQAPVLQPPKSPTKLAKTR